MRYTGLLSRHFIDLFPLKSQNDTNIAKLINRSRVKR